MENICSKENKLIKYCRKLASNKDFRFEQNEVFVEGYRLSFDAYCSQVEISTLLVTQAALSKWHQLTEVCDHAAQVVCIDDKIAKHLADTSNPQGVFAVCKMPDTQNSSYKGKFLLLDAVQDPGNVGTIIRTAEAFGITEIILSSGCADVWSSKVLRSAMGSMFRQNIRYASNLVYEIEQLKQHGTQVYAAALNPTAVSVTQISSLTKSVAVVVGNEGNGVSDAVSTACKHIYIPMTEKIESLNVATAATVICWEMFKQ